MAYKRKSAIAIEAYQYSGVSVSPGWPVGWITKPVSFSPDQKIVYIENETETTEGKKDDFIVLIKGRYFACKQSDFNKEFEPS